jgi:hypothetical protein
LLREGNAGQWRGITPPAVEFIVADFFPAGMAALLVANGGSGKTLLMQCLGSAAAAGKMFLGRETRRCKVVGIFAEDPAAVLHKRQESINTHYGITYDDLDQRFFPVSFFGHDTRLWKQGGPTDFFKSLEAQIRDIGDVGLILVDNAALVFGGNENDRAEVTPFMAALNGLAARIGAALVLSTHGSKSQDGTTVRAVSGSTAWQNAARAVLHLEPAGEGRPAVLSLIKANHARPNITVSLEWKDNLLVPVSATDAAAQVVSIEEEAVRLVREGEARSFFYSMAKNVTDKSRYLPGAVLLRVNASARAVEEAVDRLFRTDRLRTGNVKGARTVVVLLGAAADRTPDAIFSGPKMGDAHMSNTGVPMSS